MARDDKYKTGISHMCLHDTVGGPFVWSRVCVELGVRQPPVATCAGRATYNARNIASVVRPWVGRALAQRFPVDRGLKGDVERRCVLGFGPLARPQGPQQGQDRDLIERQTA